MSLRAFNSLSSSEDEGVNDVELVELFEERDKSAEYCKKSERSWRGAAVKVWLVFFSERI